MRGEDFEVLSSQGLGLRPAPLTKYEVIAEYADENIVINPVWAASAIDAEVRAMSLLTGWGFDRPDDMRVKCIGDAPKVGSLGVI
jgi:hypothetical protein